MFNIPGKQALTITETATAQIRKLMEQGNKRDYELASKKAGAPVWNIQWIMLMT